MPFQLSGDEELIRSTVRQFAQGIGLERAAHFDRHDEMPLAILQEAAGLGLMGLATQEGGATAMALALDEVAQVCPNTAALLATHTAAARIVAAAGRDGLAQRMASGELAALLVSEEAFGSSTGVGTVARATQGGGWSLTGQKAWVTGAAGARHFVVLAQPQKDGKPSGAAGGAWFHVPSDSAGATAGGPDPIMGLRGAGIRTLYLYDVAAGADGLLSGEGPPLRDEANSWLRVATAAALCGCIAGGLAAAARFAQDRVQFQAPIGTYQAVSDGVTEIDVQLAAARSLTLAAAARLGQPDQAVWAARAKAFAAQAAVACTRRAIRVQGGTGFMREGGTERFARDARALQFLGEPDWVQRDVLKRAAMPDIAWPVKA